MIAEHLGLPHLGQLGQIDISGSTVSGVRQLDEGTQRVHAELPAVISVNESNPDARFPSFKGIMGAKKKPVETRTLADLGVSAPGAKTNIASTVARPPRSAGTKVVDDGTAATQLADFLVSSRLV